VVKIGVIGATGVTGGFAYDEAERRGLEPIAIGRNRAKLDAFAAARGHGASRVRVADVHDDDALRDALDGLDAVISTVAPFTDHGFPVARAAAELGLGYTDPSGEAGFALRVVAELDPVATETGASLCTGNGISAFLGDIAMRWITDQDPHSSGTVIYDIRGYRPSSGTLESYVKHILPAGGPLVRDGVVTCQPLGAFSAQAAGMSGIHGVTPDPIVIARYWPAAQIDGLFRMPAALHRVAEATGHALLRPRLRNLLTRLPVQHLTDPNADSRAHATVTAEFDSATGTIRRREARTNSIYRFTGIALAATIEAIGRRGHDRPIGVRAASEMFNSINEVIELTGISITDR
jgi:short subunit dehydrogenase-like uncharacterized protein